jgi:hypothetical protein
LGLSSFCLEEPAGEAYDVPVQTIVIYEWDYEKIAWVNYGWTSIFERIIELLTRAKECMMSYSDQKGFLSH